MHKNFLQVADRLMEEVRTLRSGKDTIVDKVAVAVEALIQYLKDQDSGVGDVPFEFAPCAIGPAPTVKDIADKLAKAQKMQFVINDLGSWASAAQDDKGCCTELKVIFLRLLELCDVPQDFHYGTGSEKRLSAFEMTLPGPTGAQGPEGVDGADFCTRCGANIPPIIGEGTCRTCDPFGFLQNPQLSDSVKLAELVAEVKKRGFIIGDVVGPSVADMQDKADEEMGEYIANGGLCDEDKCVMGCRGCGDKNQPITTAIDVLRKMNDLISLGDLGYRIREDEGLDWEGPKVVAWGIACAQMKQLFEKDERAQAKVRGLIIYGSRHNYSGPVPDEMLVKEMGCLTSVDPYRTPQPAEPTRLPEPSHVEPWPSHWPKYYHRNEPCDMKVGHCSCGTYHDEGEFTLQNDGLGNYYVKREFKKWPGDHVGAGGYNSACNCGQCKSIRTNAAMRDR